MYCWILPTSTRMWLRWARWLENPDGTYQQSFAAFPHPLIEPFISASQLASCRPPPTTPFAVDIISGACLMVRRNIVQQVGGLIPRLTQSTPRNSIGAIASGRQVTEYALCRMPR